MSSPTTQLQARHRRCDGSERSDRARALVTSLNAGGDREQIFRELFDLYRRSIHAFFKRSGFAEEDCRDLAQETYLRVGRGIDDFRGESRFETWLYEIAANVRQKEIRRRRAIKRDMKEVSLDGLPVEPPGEVPLLGGSSTPSPEDELLDKEGRELVREVVEQMPPQMRRCYLPWAEGFKYREIAVLMGININTVRSHLGEAKARLKRRLGAADDGQDL